MKIELTERELTILIESMQDTLIWCEEAMKDEPEGSMDYEEYRASYEEDTTLVNKLTSYKK